MNPVAARLSRRSLLSAAALGAAGLASGAVAQRRRAPVTTALRRYSARARELVARATVIDMLASPRLDLEETAWTRPLTDKERADFLGSGITGFHNATGVGGPTARTDALTFLAGWQGFAGRNPDVFSLVGTVADLDRTKAEGKVGVIMGLQNAEQFDTVKDVALFHGLGLRCAQLTYNSMNRLGSGCTDRADGGVSDYGREVIAEMERVGMLVDTSHCGDRTTLDAIALATGPIAITHSNCRVLSKHPRSKTDETIVALAKKGGVMGITGVRQFVKDRDPTTVRDIVDHVEHVARLTSFEHVGIGSDADLYGYDDMPPAQLKLLRGAYTSAYAFREKIDVDDFDHPLKMYDLTDEMIRRSWSDRDIALVLGGAFRRLLGQVWKQGTQTEAASPRADKGEDG